MPRRLLRDGRVVEDDWRYLAEAEVLIAGSEDPRAAVRSVQSLIIPFAAWLGQRDEWLKHTGRLGVVLLPADKVDELAPDVGRFALIAAEFPGPSDGRGYTQARLLRERWKFGGEMRAGGYVRRDQLFFLARCGFNSFELPENELASAVSAFTTYTAQYQPSNDAGLPFKLRHRQAATVRHRPDTPASVENAHPPSAQYGISPPRSVRG